MILNAAFLVPRQESDGFSRRVEALEGARAERGIEFVYSAPWPPYNFVRLEED